MTKKRYVSPASSGTLSVNAERHSLQFKMDKGLIDNEGSFRLIDGEQSVYEVPLQSQEDLARAYGNPAHLYLSQIGGEIQFQGHRLEDLRRDMAMDAATSWMMGDFVGLTHKDWERQTTQLAEAKYRYGRLHVVPHRRWASGFSCLAFALIGIPVAMRLRTGNYATTFGVCFLPILFLYYPLFMFGLNGAKMGTLPPWSAWLGNIACAASRNRIIDSRVPSVNDSYLDAPRRSVWLNDVERRGAKRYLARRNPLNCQRVWLGKKFRYESRM